MSILSLKDVTSGYGNVVIVREINLNLKQGSIFCLLGRNGVGKSTLLKTIIGTINTFKGEIYFQNKEISKLKSHEIVRLGVSYAAQESAVFSNLTVQENLAIGQKKDGNLEQRLNKIYNYFPILKERLSQKAGSLSGGEKKMLLLSRGIISSPKLMLLDEITEGVQPSVINSFQAALKDLNQHSGTSILFTEQNLDFALSIADEFAVMNQGQIVEKGQVDAGTKDKIQPYLTL